MKKATILVPDRVYRVVGSSSRSSMAEVDTTPERIEEALVGNDYHCNTYFPAGSVHVLLLEESTEGPGGGADPPATDRA